MMSRRTGNARGEEASCPRCQPGDSHYGRTYFPQGLASHMAMHRRDDGGYTPKKPRLANPVIRTNKSKTITASLNDYLKAISDGSLSQARRNVSLARRLNERIVSAQESGKFLLALKLTERRTQTESEADMAELEQLFIDNAKAYGERHGIGYRSWQEMGVPTKVLTAAGIKRNGVSIDGAEPADEPDDSSTEGIDDAGVEDSGDV